MTITTTRISNIGAGELRIEILDGFSPGVNPRRPMAVWSRLTLGHAEISDMSLIPAAQTLRWNLAPSKVSLTPSFRKVSHFRVHLQPCHLGHRCYASPSKLNLSATRSGRPALLFDLPTCFHAYRLRISDRSGRPALSPDYLYGATCTALILRYWF